MIGVGNGGGGGTSSRCLPTARGLSLNGHVCVVMSVHGHASTYVPVRRDWSVFRVSQGRERTCAARRRIQSTKAWMLDRHRS
jgi:hypothetical protein